MGADSATNHRFAEIRGSRAPSIIAPLNPDQEGPDMDTTSHTYSLDLPADRTIVLRDVRDARVDCLRGRLWITEVPLRSDIVLDTGESHVVRADGRTLVTAFGDSRFRVRGEKRVVQRPRGAPFAAMLDALSRRAASRWLAAD
jgi:hypothetical protein